LNGIRSAARKGFFQWVKNQNADVICVQEIKAQENHILDSEFLIENYHAYFHYAEKKGYSGVGIYSRHLPKQVVTGLGWESADTEGRYVAIDLGKIWVASIYMPSGTSGEHRQVIKFDFLKRYSEHLKTIDNHAYIICGDLNIAHKPIDLKNWKANQKNTGFLPEERAWVDHLLGELGYIDAFREVIKDPDHYTWWSNRGQARAKNVGWRIDYQILSASLKNTAQAASIYTQERFSDHAPLIIDYNIDLLR
jgi:exodeoxyribonuclease-3